ncbi:glycosyltransferase family 4 protein (plasmid) [Paracoccus liaowanqingii]|uniref:Glycosyltransferase family 4 protein n=1 Tax=Paracoccus liaowanqingii TaxID=2560053 RepID=A0A4Y5STE6_9RHOB|nr:glycosyltransferase [Paracoccus liaowanqingii]QDA36787.1 glycosyltransferase family 4 protein [Paracoccus liaowanqingii]
MTGAASNDPGLPSRKLRFLYIQPGTSTFAGIERVVDTVCTGLAEEYGAEFDVDVLYTSVHSSFPSGPRKYNAIHRVARSRADLLRIYRRVIGRRRYDLVIVPQVEPTVRCWFACLGRRQRFAMHLHGNPALERMNLRSQIVFFLMRHLVLDRLGGVFGTSPRQLRAFKAMYPTNVSDFWVPNPVRQFTGIDDVVEPVARPVTFVNVGRFAHQKGQDILIRAFSQVLRDRPDVLLRLVGFGNDEANLRDLIRELGLGHAVRIEHYPTSPEIPLRSSDVFVSASRWEGWSLAICEALRFGLPVVSTDCDFGPSDILTDRRFGMLVPPGDEDALADAMRYYRDNIQAEQAHADLRRKAMDDYSAGRVVHAHAAALRSAVGQ